MKQIILALWCLLMPAAAASAAETKEPAGYVLSYDLRGEDLANGTAIVRYGGDGNAIKPQVWMPLYSGDVVFIRDPASRLTLDLAGMGRHDVTGAEKRYIVAAGGGTDDSWNIFTQIAELFGGNGETPINLVSKADGSLSVPMAVRGPNLIVRDKRPVWIAWSASRGPYGVTLDVEGKRVAVATKDETELEMPFPAGVRQRFRVIISDGLGKRAEIVFQVRKSAPRMPAALREEAARHGSRETIEAGWLAAQGRGEWRFEVARKLRALPDNDATAAMMLRALGAGWRPTKG